MDLKKFRQIIREEVKKAIQEELKDVLSEAVKIASTPKEESNIKYITQPYTKIESKYKPKFSEIMAENKTSIPTGNPILDLLNETANEGEWRSLNGGYNTNDAVNWASGMSSMGGINTPVVPTVNQMISQQGPVNDINDIKIDAVPDFTGIMSTLKEKGKI